MNALKLWSNGWAIEIKQNSIQTKDKKGDTR